MKNETVFSPWDPEQIRSIAEVNSLYVDVHTALLEQVPEERTIGHEYEVTLPYRDLFGEHVYDMLERLGKFGCSYGFLHNDAQDITGIRMTSQRLGRKRSQVDVLFVQPMPSKAEERIPPPVKAVKFDWVQI